MINHNIQYFGNIVTRSIRKMNAMKNAGKLDLKPIGTFQDKLDVEHTVSFCYQEDKKRIHYFVLNGEDKIVGAISGLLKDEYIELIFGGITPQCSGKGLMKQLCEIAFAYGKDDEEVDSIATGKYFTYGYYTAPAAQYIGKQMLALGFEDVSAWICEEVSDICDENKIESVEDLDKVTEKPKNRLFVGRKANN